ncbi:hypothetical protein R5R35_001145 [Gryllus longicercus]|uniref:CHK kinase-like domain-containing protein n=1 Tax=Gryllus longicercus TaxID=2509291 RepID=A0AAN9ZAU7_9ORTH
MGEQAQSPAWLDKAFVRTALRHAYPANAHLEVLALQVAPALGAGENYCSSLYRVAATTAVAAGSGGEGAAGEEHRVLVKVLPAGGEGEWASLVAESRLFTKEAQVMADVLPEMMALLAEAAARAGQPPPPPFAARCLHHGKQPGPGAFLVLQDLSPEGFRMRERVVGLGAAEARVALRALARLHASSAVLLRRRPALFDGLLSIFDDAGRDTRSVYYPRSLRRTANTLAAWTDFPPHYAEKILALEDKFFPKLQEVNRPRPGKFNALIHGDFWTNNLLFRYEDDEVQDVRMVDFQLTHVGNPAIDLVLFRFVSLTEETFDSEWPALLEEYRAALAAALASLAGPGDEERKQSVPAAPTAEELRAWLTEAAPYAVLAACVWAASVRRDVGRLDLDAVVHSDDASRDVHTAPTFCRWLRKLVPVLEREGVLDAF